MRHRLIAAVGLMSAISLPALGHGLSSLPEGDDRDRRIEFPDTTQYKVLVFDPHTHTSFSDGHVWPTIRIEEALRDGLDAIACTEHLEYQPHLEDIPHPDRNRSYQIAADAAKETELMVIPGAEVTRNTEGHMNALFTADANLLFKAPSPRQPFDAKEYWEKAIEWPALEAVKAANAQGAFVFWNHPILEGGGNITVLTDFHRNNIRNGLVHGIEIANGPFYYEKAFQIALEHNLTLMGSSDIHGLIDWEYEPHKGGHRPVTLVLAKDKTPEALKQALFARRTVVWFENMLMGRPEHLNALLDASLVSNAEYGPLDMIKLSINNRSNATFILRYKGEYALAEGDLIKVPAYGTANVTVKTGKKAPHIEMEFEVLNALTAPKQTASITLNVNPQSETNEV